MKKFNDWMGDKLSNGLSSMTVFYVISFLVLIPLLVQTPVGFMGWIQYLSTAVLQACALPLLGYTTKKQGDIQAQMAQETHDTVMSELDLIKTQQIDNKKLVSAQHKITKELKELITTKVITNKVVSNDVKDLKGNK